MIEDVEKERFFKNAILGWFKKVGKYIAGVFILFISVLVGSKINDKIKENDKKNKEKLNKSISTAKTKTEEAKQSLEETKTKIEEIKESIKENYEKQEAEYDKYINKQIKLAENAGFKKIDKKVE